MIICLCQKSIASSFTPSPSSSFSSSLISNDTYEFGPWSQESEETKGLTLLDLSPPEIEIPGVNEETETIPPFSGSPDSERSHFYLQEVWFSRPYEAGVVDRLLVESFNRINLTSYFSLLTGAGLSLFDQWGLSLVAISGVVRFPALLSELTFGLQHEMWPSWNMNENRAVVYWSFAPFEFILFSLGYSYRSPQYATNFIKSLGWDSSASEFGLVYRVEADVFQYKKFKVTLLSFDYDRMKLYTWTNIHFVLQPQYQLSPNLKLNALIGVAAEGVSGGVISWEQQNIGIGVAYVIP